MHTDTGRKVISEIGGGGAMLLRRHALFEYLGDDEYFVYSAVSYAVLHFTQ